MCEFILTQRERDEHDWQAVMHEPMPEGTSDAMAREMADTARQIRAMGQTFRAIDTLFDRMLGKRP
jgi:hypothetical protein